MSEFLSSADIKKITDDYTLDSATWTPLGDEVINLIHTCKKLREALAQHHKGKKFCRKCLIHVTGEKET